MSASHHLLVIGCGSIGERHVRTFLATGRTRVSVCDQRPAARLAIACSYSLDSHSNWEEALADSSLTGVVIATPAPLHVPMALRALEFGLHVLIEKPLSIALDRTEHLLAAQKASDVFVTVAYVQHCQPALQAARSFIREGSFGPVKQVVVTAGSHFPSARPAYREIYYRDPAQGGGAIQDALTHLANAVEWIVGPTTRVFCDASHQVLADVEVEDTVSVAARNGGVLVSYAFNQFQAPRELRLDFHAEHGSVRVELHRQRWGKLPLGASDWVYFSTPLVNRDALYITQAYAFLDGCEGHPGPLCTLSEGLQTLRFNMAALQSWRENRPITL